ncbi:hypothetical protein PSJE_18260 [Pseudomonas jessenii]|nr:hypothetical protein PSJE_18260 [Pseudomonas jessenii]
MSVHIAPTSLVGRGLARVHADPVGASLLAMEVNDDAGCLDERGALTCIASKLAPTKGRCNQIQGRRFTS